MARLGRGLMIISLRSFRLAALGEGGRRQVDRDGQGEVKGWGQGRAPRG